MHNIEQKAVDKRNYGETKRSETRKLSLKPFDSYAGQNRP